MEKIATGAGPHTRLPNCRNTFSSPLVLRYKIVNPLQCLVMPVVVLQSMHTMKHPDDKVNLFRPEMFVQWAGSKDLVVILIQVPGFMPPAPDLEWIKEVRI
jgi:hypothetical protein